MKLHLLFFTFLFSSFIFSQNATISGTIYDKEYNNEPLPFANVYVKGTSKGTSSDENGKYSINIAEGNHIIVFGFLGYESQEVAVNLKSGEQKTINITLAASGVQLKDIVVKGVITTNKETETSLLKEQQNATVIKQSIGSYEMQRKGVSNVEQGVTKISGVSKVADRGLFVRGLDDRYNYFQLNGLNLVPSDPNLKTIPLYYIPSDVVRNIDVFKTYNTDLYQDFAGASINVFTKDISNKPVTKISLSTGFNTNTTFKDFTTSKEGALDFWGYSGNNRNLPSVFSYNNPLQYNASATESKDMFNASWNPEFIKAPLTFGTNIFHSNSHELSNDRKWGYLFNFGFSNNYLFQEGVRRNLNSSGFATKDFRRTFYQNTTQKSFLSSFNLKKSDHYNFAFNIIYLHNSENNVDEVRGDNTDFITLNKPFFLRDTKFVENSTYAIQHLGSLYFKDKKNILDYGIGVSLGKNDMPDRKALITEGEAEDADYVTYNGADPFRFFATLENKNVNGKATYEINFGLNEDENTTHTYKNTLKFGFNSDATFYNLNHKTIRMNGGSLLLNTNMNTNNPQEFFDEAFDNGTLNYRSNADPTYEVNINQFTQAAFVNYKKNFEKLSVDAGARVEYLFRELKYRPEVGASVNDPMQKLEYEPLTISPIVNIKYLVNEKSNVRFTASKTNTRPRMRELLPFRFSDGDGNFVLGFSDIVSPNDELKNTTNYNADLKYEIFPTPSSIFSATLFGKYIQDPISRLLASTSTGYLTTYDNFDFATVMGVEVESNFGLDLFFEESTISKNTTIGFNASFMKTKEEVDKGKFPLITNSTRSLQGASDFIINADIAYRLADSEKLESKVNFIFNTFSERVYAVGVDGADDIKEQPIPMLDFTWRNTFNKKYQLNLTVKNILDSQFKTTQDASKPLTNSATYSNINQQLTIGTNIGLEFIYTF